MIRGTFTGVVLPEASVTVTAIEYCPLGRTVPALGFCVITSWLTTVQLSVAKMPPSTLGTTPWQLASAEIVIGPGLLRIVGGVLSAMVRGTFTGVVLPEASATVTAIEYCPLGRTAPALGFC